MQSRQSKNSEQPVDDAIANYRFMNARQLMQQAPPAGDRGFPQPVASHAMLSPLDAVSRPNPSCRRQNAYQQYHQMMNPETYGRQGQSNPQALSLRPVSTTNHAETMPGSSMAFQPTDRISQGLAYQPSAMPVQPAQAAIVASNQSFQGQGTAFQPPSWGQASWPSGDGRSETIAQQVRQREQQIRSERVGDLSSFYEGIGGLSAGDLNEVFRH